MTPGREAASAVPESSHGALAELVVAFLAHQGGRAGEEEVGPYEVAPGQVTIRSAEVVRAGRPGLISVIAEVPGRVVHAVFGLRSPGDDVQFLADADDAPLGIFEDEHGLAVVFDALADAELALALLDAVAGDQGPLERVRRLSMAPDSVSLTFDDRLMFTIFQQLPGFEVPHPGLELLLGLDTVGFNHVLAPRALWRRGRTDLGIVQEYQAGSTGGWALALTSLRDLYAAGGPPEHAGGDFATEAGQLGTMTARMHIGLGQAFGRKEGEIALWAAAVEEAVRSVNPDLLDDPTVSMALADLRASTGRAIAIRTHGDFHLGRVARMDLGWFVLDFSPGGTPLFSSGVVPGDGAVFRSPLADVADMLWSFHHVAGLAAIERDPTNSLGLSELAQAWETRNRRAFLAGYLDALGIDDLMPSNREVVRQLAAVFELERSASAPTVVPAPTDAAMPGS